MYMKLLLYVYETINNTVSICLQQGAKPFATREKPANPANSAYYRRRSRHSIVIIIFFRILCRNTNNVRMKKEKYTLEYIFDKASKITLWTRIATSSGLSEWFADEVIENNDNIYSFVWNKHPADARLTGSNPNTYIRFHWLDDDDEETYFEFRLHRNEITGGLVLEVTDFAELHDKENSIALWDSQVTVLRRILGVL